MVNFSDVDLWVPSAIHAFFVESDFFEQFFAWSDARKDDGYIAFRFSAQTDEVTGEVDDFDGFSHVEDEDFAVLSHGSSLHDELARLGDRHEIAHHIGVCDGERAALADLLAE